MGSPNQDTIKSYENTHQDYTDSRSPEQSAQYLKWVIDELAELKNPQILEIGTGTGYDADYLDRLGYNITRSDAVEGFINQNQARGKSVVKLDVINDRIEKEYDLIFAINVLQHMDQEDFKKSIQNLNAGLKSGGRLLFSITVGAGDTEWHDDKGGARVFLNWQPDKLTQILEQEGFESIKLKEIGYKNWVQVKATKSY